MQEKENRSLGPSITNGKNVSWPEQLARSKAARQLAAEKNNSLEVVDDSGDSVGYPEYEPSKKSIMMPIFGRRLKKAEPPKEVALPVNPILTQPQENDAALVVPKKRPGRPKGSGKKQIQNSIVSKTSQGDIASKGPTAPKREIKNVKAKAKVRHKISFTQYDFK
jgi:hypothetical protein